MIGRQTLVLWDVDHTLIENSGVSKATYALAFELLVGRAPEARPATDGRTDGQIMRELFIANGIEMTPAHQRALFDTLTAAMDRNADALRERGYALPGAAEAIAALNGLPGLVQSALTGNIAYNARVKLSAFHLDTLLDLEVGGYGSDHVVRSQLVAIAQDKATAKNGARFDRGSTLLIGDTPRDVQAGVKGGALVLGVASGTFDQQELRAAAADAVLPDLQDTALVVASCRTLLFPS